MYISILRTLVRVTAAGSIAAGVLGAICLLQKNRGSPV